MLGYFFHLVHRFSDFLSQISDRSILTEAGRNGHIGFIIRQDACQAVVFRCVFIDLVDYTGQSSDDMTEPDDLGSQLCHF